MYIKKRLGQTAALLLAGMAVGLAGGAFAADSTVPKEWNINSNFKLGASLQAFDTKPAWVGALGEIEAVSAGLPSGRANTWFTENTKVLNMTSESVIATNTLIADDSSVVSFAVDPVYVDARVKLVVLADAPSTTGAKLAIYASATDKLKVVHNGGTNEYTLTGKDLVADWHQLTVKLNTAGTFDVLVDDASVATGLTLIGGTGDKTLDQLEFSGTGKLDQLYVSHGNPAYLGTMGAIPTAITGDLDDEASVNNWLAHLIYDSVITTSTTFPGFTKAQLDAAYLLDELKLVDGVATPVAYTFGVSAIDLVSPTLVKVTCKLTVDAANKEDTITGRIRLLGKDTIGGPYSTMSPDAISPKNTDFTGGLATYDFTVPSGKKFFKAQIVE
jgi:hypothetical protein